MATIQVAASDEFGKIVKFSRGSAHGLNRRVLAEVYDLPYDLVRGVEHGEAYRFKRKLLRRLIRVLRYKLGVMRAVDAWEATQLVELIGGKQSRSRCRSGLRGYTNRFHRHNRN